MLYDYAIINRTDPEVFLQGLKVKRRDSWKNESIIRLLTVHKQFKGKKPKITCVSVKEKERKSNIQMNLSITDWQLNKFILFSH